VSVVVVIILVAGLWLLVGWAAGRIMDNPRNDAIYGFGLAFTKLYVRLFHGLRVRGPVPTRADGRGLIVVVNHTAGVDPVLVQAACPFEIRWMMGRDMMIPSLDWWWEWLDIIPVDRGQAGKPGNDPTAAKEAIRHLRAGGTVGVFPEGSIERPPRTLKPFAPGIGLLVRMTKARVLPVIIEGTPVTNSAWGSLSVPSRSKVTLLPIYESPPGKKSAEEITDAIQNLFVQATGWPVKDR
jgi:1-acyl-sn-glycerol-3-phosphate acyltransferase